VLLEGVAGKDEEDAKLRAAARQVAQVLRKRAAAR
jgi:hypothetical protein